MVDDVHIRVKAGNGGNGKVSLRHIKYFFKGGPDGGDGGRGGSVYLVGNRNLNTLHHFMGRKRFAAEPGGDGGDNSKHGHNGEDLEIEVPLGTVVDDLGEIIEEGQRLLVARGGRGGRGNEAFKSSTNQTPMTADSGTPGEEKELHLQLKVLANVGLVGFPNAGKSTVLSVLTAAQPEIANYPFTTLSPNLGVIPGYKKEEERGLILADIPGLIEGAAQGKGLGHNFLRHIERCSVLVFVLYLEEGFLFADTLDETQKAHMVMQQYEMLRKELEEFNPDLLKKRHIIGVNKIDTYPPELQEKIRHLFHVQHIEVLLFSAATHEGIEELRAKIFAMQES